MEGDDASPRRCRAKREHLVRFQGLLPESQGLNLALTVLYVLCSPDSGSHRACFLCEDRVLDGPASGEKGSTGKN